ncbi:MAG: class I SAM-dependent methyltransferase [Isosphaeraceae bacterium]
MSTALLDPAEVAAHYDDLDLFYRAFWGEHVHHGLFDQPGLTPEQATLRLVTEVADRARIGEGSSVCDVGCGYGATARWLAQKRSAAVTALTISGAQHAYATSLAPNSVNPRYLLRDWLYNDLEDDQFDALIAIESSEHMPDLAAFFVEAGRVLRPGGRMVVCAWLTRETPGKWERRWLVDPICREGRMRGMESVAEYQRLAKEAGLSSVEAWDVSRHVKKTWPICAWRVVKGLLKEPAYRRFLLRDGGPNRIFALTLLRIWVAYELGAMRYGLLTFEKPGHS